MKHLILLSMLCATACSTANAADPPPTFSPHPPPVDEAQRPRDGTC